MRPCALGFALFARASIPDANANLCRVCHAFTDDDANQFHTVTNGNRNRHTN